VKRFAAWAERVGYPGDVPLTEEQLCSAAVYHTLYCKHTSLPNFISAVADWHRRCGFGELPRGGLYRGVAQGLRNFWSISETVVRAEPLLLEDLRAIGKAMQYGRADPLFWCMVIFAFFAMLRVGEHAGGALRFGRVRRGRGVVRITVAFSKTSFRPITLELVCRTDELCPVRALDMYLLLIERYAPFNRSDPFFGRWSNNRWCAVSAADFVNNLRKWVTVSASTRCPHRITGHSPRRGCTTEMVRAGVSEVVIMKHGRWASAAFHDYVDWAATRHVATERLALASGGREVRGEVFGGSRA
jgi:integrase